MTHRLPLIAMGAGSVLILLSFVWTAPVAVWLFAIVTMSFPVALIVLAVASRGGVRPIAADLLVLFLLLQTSGLGVLAFAKDATPRFLGLPAGALLMLGGLWLFPLLLLSLRFPQIFDRAVLDRGTLDRIRNTRSHHARDASQGEG